MILVNEQHDDECCRWSISNHSEISYKSDISEFEKSFNCDENIVIPASLNMSRNSVEMMIIQQNELDDVDNLDTLDTDIKENTYNMDDIVPEGFSPIVSSVSDMSQDSQTMDDIDIDSPKQTRNINIDCDDCYVGYDNNYNDGYDENDEIENVINVVYIISHNGIISCDFKRQVSPDIVNDNNVLKLL